MEDMFDSSNSEVFTGKFVVAIAGVETDVEEVEPVGAEAIELDQELWYHEKLSEILEFSITEM